MMISQLNPNTTYYTYYKYEYFNHDHINEYQNALQINNCVIINDLASKVSFQDFMTLGRKKENNIINIVI